MNPAEAARMAEKRFRFFAEADDSWLTSYYCGQVIPLREWLFMGLTTAPAIEILRRKDWIAFAEQAGFILAKKGIISRSRSKKNTQPMYRMNKRWWKSPGKRK